MLGHRQLNIEDYLGILRRRRWLILCCTVAILGAGVGLSYWIPPQYESQTLVLIEMQKVPTDYVTPVLTEDLGERLASLREQILSRSRLEPIIQRFNLFAGGHAAMDDRVVATQRAIGVKPIPSSASSHGMPGFYITFRAPDARTAQAVCSEITSLFVSENLNAREESAEGTTEFLKQQLADAKKNLDDQDEKLAEFERKYIGRLPGQQTSNQSTLQALTTQLDAATQSLDRLQENETFLEANIAEQTHELKNIAASYAAMPETVVGADEQQKQLNDLLEQKRALEAAYTSDHPDVQAISRKIADLQAAIKRTSAGASQGKGGVEPTVPEPPRLQQERAQLRAMQQAIVSAKQEQNRIQGQIREYEGRIESSPLVEQEYKQVTRDHDIASEFYNNLLKKMDESSMAMALEHRQEGEQFRVMDPPNLPDAPKFPNRMFFAGGGFAGGLTLGLVLAALLEYRDTTLRTELDVTTFTKLQTLAVLSHVEGIAEKAGKRGPRGAPDSLMVETVESTGA